MHSQVANSNALDVSLEVSNDSKLSQVYVNCRGPRSRSSNSRQAIVLVNRDFGYNEFTSFPRCLYERKYNQRVEVYVHTGPTALLVSLIRTDYFMIWIGLAQ